MSYNGTQQQLNNVKISGSTSEVVFKTTDVNVTLDASSGEPLSSGSADYYANGWHALGATTGGHVEVQMLPGSWDFLMSYNGTRQQISNVAISGASAEVPFTTSDVTVKLQGSEGEKLDNGTVDYYANGWYPAGTTSDGQVEVQMLPGSWDFLMSYLGTKEQLSNISVGLPGTSVTFETGKVVSTSGAATAYYASGWQPFTSGMQLLPGAYPFVFNDGTPQTNETVEAGKLNEVH